ncbi:MAG: peptidyl-prolyl cis-trans isomerase [Burkholderiales bacterium]|nr:peptidyl-prolyl cis-trans isomerase [Burkholderiales bacterium]
MKRSLIYGLMTLTCFANSACNKSELQTTSGSQEKAAGSAIATAPEKMAVQKLIAVVNGENITEEDIKPLLDAGIEKAIALDRYINKIVAAQSAEKQFKADALQTMKSVERDVLSQLYLQKTSQRIERQISEADLKGYYEKNVKIEDFQQYNVSYYLTQDKADAETVSREAQEGSREVLARFKPIKDGADKYVFLKDMPYGLGQVIRPMKANTFSKPIALRNGFFVLHIAGIKEGKRPELASVITEIKNILMTERVTQQLEQQRSAAKIELK